MEPTPSTRLMWWLAALLVVPTGLAGLALLWPGPPALAEAGAVPRPPAPAAGPPAAGPLAVGPPAAGPATPAPELLSSRVTEALVAQPILFAADSAELPGPSAAAVQRVAELLVAAPAVPVLVEGHVADTPGGPEAARLLSEQRAAAVAAALVRAGVPAERITAVGRGAERPLATVAQSRRVEIAVGR